MDLSPYLETLRADLLNAAALGGAEIGRAAELLGGALESSMRLALLEALSDAAAEITTSLESASVEVRLRGREAQFVVAEGTAEPNPSPTYPLDGDQARLTLRIPEALKEHVEARAAGEGVSVNAWLVRTIAAAAAPSRSDRRRITGFAQA
jgi:predicted HicB family RNase H-like nuclease